MANEMFLWNIIKILNIILRELKTTNPTGFKKHVGFTIYELSNYLY